MKKQSKRTYKLRLIAITIVSLLVVITGSLFSFKSFENGNISGGIAGIFIAVTMRRSSSFERWRLKR